MIILQQALRERAALPTAVLRSLEIARAIPAETRLALNNAERSVAVNLYDLVHWEKRQAGYRHQMRFDLTEKQIRRELGDYGLYHNLTNDSDISLALDNILEHNGAMVSTVEKMRIGVPVGGMSPTEDMDSGGASYFFTRIRKLPGRPGGDNRTGFYFKPELLRRMDAITYEGDKYGRVTGNHVRQYRRVTIDGYKRIERRRYTDETIFKNEVTLLDNIKVVVVRNAAQQREVIEVFHKHGISKLPDGRSITSVVKVIRK